MAIPKVPFMLMLGLLAPVAAVSGPGLMREEVSLLEDALELNEKTDEHFMQEDARMSELLKVAQRDQESKGGCSFGFQSFLCEDGHRCEYADASNDKVKMTIERHGSVAKITSAKGFTYYQKYRSGEHKVTYFFHMIHDCNGPAVVRSFPGDRVTDTSMSSCSQVHLAQEANVKGAGGQQFKVQETCEMEEITKYDSESGQPYTRTCLHADASAGSDSEHDDMCLVSKTKNTRVPAWATIDQDTRFVVASGEALFSSMGGNWNLFKSEMQAQGKSSSCPGSLRLLEQSSLVETKSSRTLDDTLCGKSGLIGIFAAAGVCIGIGWVPGGAAVCGIMMAKGVAAYAVMNAATCAASAARKR